MNLRKEDILLVLPPSRFKDRRYSLSLLCISSYLRANGFENIIVERGLFKKETWEFDHALINHLMVEKIKELRPKIIGFTASTQEFDEVVNLNQELKKNLSFLSLIGGPHATTSPAEFLNNGFDIAVMGEGEETTLELVFCAKNKFEQQEKDKNFDVCKDFLKDLKNIRGIVYKNLEGEIIANQRREFIDISDLPIPAYDKIDMESYIGMSDRIIRGVIVRGASIMTSRGCPYSCTFCDCNKVFGHGVRYRGLDNIRQELKLLKENYDVEGIWLADDTFTLNKEHILGVGSIMKEFNLIWGCQARVNLVDDDLVRVMKRDGCVQFDFGVESGSQRILDEIMNKKTNLDQIRRAFAICRRHRVRTLANFMMGLPTETKEEMEQTMKLAREIKADVYMLTIFTPLPGTELFDRYFKEEITTGDYKEMKLFAGVERFNKSKVRSLKELNDRWRKDLTKEMKKRYLDNPWAYLEIFFKLKHKKERLLFIWYKIKRLMGAVK